MKFTRCTFPAFKSAYYAGKRVVFNVPGQLPADKQDGTVTVLLDDKTRISILELGMRFQEMFCKPGIYPEYYIVKE